MSSSDTVVVTRCSRDWLLLLAVRFRYGSGAREKISREGLHSTDGKLGFLNYQLSRCGVNELSLFYFTLALYIVTMADNQALYRQDVDPLFFNGLGCRDSSADALR